MLKNLKRLGLAAALTATTFVTTATVAEARGYRDRDDDAAIAIGAGIVGLAIGAAIASDHDDRYYYRDRSYYRYYPDSYYYRDRPYYRAYPDRYRYYNRYPRHDYREYRDYRGYRDYRHDRRYYRRHR